MVLSAFLGTLIAFTYCYFNNIYINFTFVKLLQNLQTFFIGAFIIQFIQPNFIDSSSFRYEITSFCLYSLISEFAFYWLHRFLHYNKRIYLSIHHHHHLEYTPHPLDAYILHPIETVLVTISLSIPDLLLIPITYRAHLLFKSLSLAVLILNHGALKTRSFHMLHHRYLNVYYGGTYPLFDYVFNTF